MGLIEGETLTERVERAGPLPVREIVRVLQDVGYALAYAHGRGVVHRDIKPDNIMIERATGRALVMDFGISRSMTHAVPAASLTRVGEVVGTPEYMSPEQAAGDVVDGRSDLYSLGLVAHFAVTGYTAVTADSTQKVLVKQLTERPPLVATLRPDIPAVLAAAIDKCVEKDPKDRFATAELLVEEIDAAQLSAPEIPVPIRLFAAEVSSLSMVTIGALVLVYFTQDMEQSLLDRLIPLVGLLAILFTSALTTLSEARRLAVAGYSADDVRFGFAAVVAERADQRAEIASNPETRLRRRNTVIAGVVLLSMAIAMVRYALSLRVQLGPNHFQASNPVIVLVFSGFALGGTSLVLLLKSPFRMPLGERLFRFVWMGPLGRAFVRLGGRNVKERPKSVRVPTGARGTIPPLPSIRTAVVAEPQDRVGALESRIAALEEWKRSKG